MDKSVSPTHKFIVPSTYDYEKSSESNYSIPDAPFVGKYQHIRQQLDYSYHKRYGVERQHLQDQLIDRFLKTKVIDHTHNLTCEVPLENWIAFTAGPMGAGKGHTIQWLYETGLFPLDAFVNVDPDAIRSLLPETTHYNQLDDTTTGHLTQKEVGYISEILSYDALQKGKNVLVDGSLRNAHWYLEYFRNLRDKFPIIKIAILHVTAKPETVLLRARNRAKVTGRVVPEETILESMRTIPESLRILSPHSEFVATFINEDDEKEPRLAYCCMQEHDDFRHRAVTCEPLAPLWCVRETRTVAPEHGRLDVCMQLALGEHSSYNSNDNDNSNSTTVDTTNNSTTNNTSHTNITNNDNNTTANTYNHNTSNNTNNTTHTYSANNTVECSEEVKCYHYGQCHMNPYFEPHTTTISTSGMSTGASGGTGTVGGSGVSTKTTGSDASANNNTITTNTATNPTTNTNTVTPTNTTNTHTTIPFDTNTHNQNSTTHTSTHNQHTTTTNTHNYTYTLVDCAHHSEEVLSTWKGLFASTWEMKCALPGISGDSNSISIPILSRANSANVKYAGVSVVNGSVVSMGSVVGSNSGSISGGSSGINSSGTSDRIVNSSVGSNNTINGINSVHISNNSSASNSASLTTQESVDAFQDNTCLVVGTQDWPSDKIRNEGPGSPLISLKRPRELEVPSLYDRT